MTTAPHRAPAGNAVLDDQGRATAVGYIRCLPSNRLGEELSASAIRRYGRGLGFDVGPVVRGSTCLPTVAVEKGFAELVEAVRACGASVVIVQSPTDLSPDTKTREWMERMIRHAGARVQTMAQPTAVGRARVPAQRMRCGR